MGNGIIWYGECDFCKLDGREREGQTLATEDLLEKGPRVCSTHRRGLGGLNGTERWRRWLDVARPINDTNRRRTGGRLDRITDDERGLLCQVTNVEEHLEQGIPYVCRDPVRDGKLARILADVAERIERERAGR